MALARDVVIPGMTGEYQSFADLIRGLSDEEWSTPTRCADWRVADVAAHVVGTLTDVVNLRLEGLGSPEVTTRQTAERRGRAPRELADELESGIEMARGIAAAFDDAAWEAPAPPGVTGTLGFGIEALWFDTYVHADDVRTALGLSGVRSEGLRPSLSHIAQVLSDQGWGPADLAFDGFEVFGVSGGGDRTISGDPLQFVLASTGRAAPASIGLDDSVNIYR